MPLCTMHLALFFVVVGRAGAGEPAKRLVRREARTDQEKRERETKGGDERSLRR